MITGNDKYDAAIIGGFLFLYVSLYMLRDYYKYSLDSTQEARLLLIAQHQYSSLPPTIRK